MAGHGPRCPMQHAAQRAALQFAVPAWNLPMPPPSRLVVSSIGCSTAHCAIPAPVVRVSLESVRPNDWKQDRP